MVVNIHKLWEEKLFKCLEIKLGIFKHKDFIQKVLFYIFFLQISSTYSLTVNNIL